MFGMIMRLIHLARKIRRRLFMRARPDGKVRLHLGCGGDYWPGYVNVDISADAVCDLRMDFTRISELYSRNSVAEVVLIHSLSYLRLWQARDLFVDLCRLLEPGGRLIIELPDLAKCARKALASESNVADYLEAVRGLYAFGMDQIENREMFRPYAFGWSGWHLKLELEKVGFQRVTLHDPQLHGQRVWRDMRVEATK
jgi:hypothetical protein